MNFACSKQLTHEFLSTLDIAGDASYLQFRMHGVARKVTVSALCKIFGFHARNVGTPSVPSTFNPNAAWASLTGFNNWESGGMPAGYIRDHVLAILHKFIAYAIAGKEEANKVNQTDLYLLHCASTHTPVCATYYIMATLRHVLATARRRPTLPLFVMAVARHLKVLEPSEIPPGDRIGVEEITQRELQYAKILSAEGRWFPPERRPCVVHYLNALAAGRADPAPDQHHDDIFADAEYEDAPMQDADPPLVGSSVSSELAQLRTDHQNLCSAFSDFRTEIYARHDRMETTLNATHALLTDQARLWQQAQEQAALHYQQVMENTRQVAALNAQWSSWALFDPPPPPDQQ